MLWQRLFPHIHTAQAYFKLGFPVGTVIPLVLEQRRANRRGGVRSRDRVWLWKAGALSWVWTCLCSVAPEWAVRQFSVSEKGTIKSIWYGKKVATLQPWRKRYTLISYFSADFLCHGIRKVCHHDKTNRCFCFHFEMSEPGAMRLSPNKGRQPSPLRTQNPAALSRKKKN